MRRRWWWALGATAIAAGAAAGWWSLWVPGYRPALGPGERYGIDVSHHQGAVDWEGVAGDGIGFAYVKATEGRDHVDTRFEENWAGAATAGLDRGAYHFFTLCSPGADQARHLLATVPADDPGELAPAVDLELAGNCADRPPAAEVRRQLDAFLDVLEAATGRPTLLYVGADWDAAYPTRGELGRPLWLRRFLRRPDGDWQVWQVSGFARVDGVVGPVDLDVGAPTVAG